MNRNFEEYRRRLETFALEGRLRTLDHRREAELIDCTTNDYLALGTNMGLRREFLRHLDFCGEIPAFGSCSSRLLYSADDCYAGLERLLESLYGRPALLFNSGYHANVGILSAMAVAETLIVSDGLVHASIIDGIRLSKASKRIFPHNDLESLKAVLREVADDYPRVIVVVESVYSMDGDLAPLKDLASLKEQYPQVILYVDEAHAFGVLGERGLGLADELGVTDKIDVLMGTLSKATASEGAFAIVSPTIKDFLVNTARSLIFSTAIPPINIRWSQYVVERIPAMTSRRKRLREISLEISDFVAEKTGTGVRHPSPIVPFMIGGNERTVKASEIMRTQGVLALPIRKPTVAEGSERLRLSLNAELSDTDLARIKEAVMTVVAELMTVS